jgi:hypothetical protein
MSSEISNESTENKTTSKAQSMEKWLSDWKYIIVTIDAVLNTADPIKSASAHAGFYTVIYALLIITNPSNLTLISTLLAIALVADVFMDKINAKVFGNYSFTGEQTKRFESFCQKFTNYYKCSAGCIEGVLVYKKNTPVKFLTVAVPCLLIIAYIGRKCSFFGLVWTKLMFECVTMVPPVKEKIQLVSGKVCGLCEKYGICKKLGCA